MEGQQIFVHRINGPIVRVNQDHFLALMYHAHAGCSASATLDNDERTACIELILKLANV